MLRFLTSFSSILTRVILAWKSVQPTWWSPQAEIIPIRTISTAATTKSNPILTYDIRYYNNTLDHVTPFSPSPRTFRHRYLVNDTYYGNGRQNIVANSKDSNCKGPIWFYTGNEGDIEGFWSSNRFMQYLTVEYGGLLVMAEERYYGKSMPTARPIDNLLTTQQILEDYAELLRYLKQEYDGAEECPTIAVGGSYGGTLSAYLRSSYPTVVQGALASSSELGYYDLEGWESNGITEFTFSEIVAQQYYNVSPKCLQAIWDAVDIIDDSEPKEVIETFHFCDSSLLEPSASSSFIYGLEGLPQQNYPYPVGNLPAWPVNAVCDILLNSNSGKSNILNRAAQVTSLTLGYSLSHTKPCLEPLPEGGPGNIPGDGPGVTSWGYQSCTETLHKFSSSARDRARLGLRNYTFHNEQFQERCKELYDVIPNTNVLAERYGGFDIGKTTTNTIFSSGSLDPWGGAALSPKNGGADAQERGVHFFRMPNGAHHLDLRGWNEVDPEDVTATRLQEEQIMVGWVKDYIVKNNDKK